jgi:hypothetical protein
MGEEGAKDSLRRLLVNFPLRPSHGCPKACTTYLSRHQCTISPLAPLQVFDRRARDSFAFTGAVRRLFLPSTDPVS